MRRLLGWMLIALGISGTAAAQVRTFVSTSGVDNAECSRFNPCRTFGAAQAAVDPDGEILALDSGGYGPFTIDKSVAIIAPSDVHAAIAPASGTAITIAAAVSNKVFLRGLYLNSQGATVGITFPSGTDLHIESCVVSGFSEGIRVDRTSFARISIKNTTVRGSSSRGAFLNAPGDIVAASISNSRFFDNQSGIRISGDVTATLTRSTVAKSPSGGINISGTDAEVNLNECLLAHNVTAVSSPSGTVRVNNTIFSGNTNVHFFNNGGTVETRENNPISDNAGGSLIVGNAAVPIAGN